MSNKQDIIPVTLKKELQYCENTQKNQSKPAVNFQVTKGSLTYRVDNSIDKYILYMLLKALT